MSKQVFIKLTRVGGIKNGPFTIYDNINNIIDENVSRKSLIEGVTYTVSDDVTLIKLVCNNTCSSTKIHPIETMGRYEYFMTETEQVSGTCLWRHLTNPEIYNKFYGDIHEYIIEYPFSYQYYDEIVQNVKDYSRVFKYISNENFLGKEVLKIETDDNWFNKAILYNGQQCTGMLNIVPKPKHNLKQYLTYPQYNSDSKTITFTKSDNFYQYNNFWNVLKDVSIPAFTYSCSHLSIDKVLNQDNMDYSFRSFQKQPLRAKELKIRQMLTDRSDTKIISQFLYSPSQLSIK